MMFLPEDLTDLPNTVRLFPLPNVVLYPYTIQPLHIFEPRYKQMTEDALAGDRLIAMALYRPGWDDLDNTWPAIHSVACLGKIITEQKLPDGRFNLLLRGICRVLIDYEIEDPFHLYRSARIVLQPDDFDVENMLLRQEIIESTEQWLKTAPGTATELRKLIEEHVPLAVLCDLIAFCVPIPVKVRQELLEEVDIGQRARRLLAELQDTPTPEILPYPKPKRKFPPDFSVN